jgi:acetylornithine deacetylase/succinyl-diaminopimelate desuccinylase-like protein
MITHAPGRSSLVARLPATHPSGEPPLCLMHHTDVATAEADQWPDDRGPLSGARVDGEVWGRGALDMKGMGALQLVSMQLLVEHGVPRSRDVVLLAVADEEVDNVGARALVDRWSTIGCSQMLNEGGLGVRDALFDGQAVHAISSAEKGILWVRMIAEGRAGHGSTPYPDEAPSRLLQAMERIERKVKVRPRIDDSLYRLLHAVGDDEGGLTGVVLKSRALTGLLVKPRLKGIPTTRATMVDTVHLTGMSGAEAPNVVPSEVWAQYDARLLPGTTPEEHLARLQKAVRKVEGIRFEVLAEEESNGSDIDSDFFRAVAHYAVEGKERAAVGPLLSVGFTDSLLLRPVGVEAFGYVPFEVPAEVAETMHGHRERVPEGVRRLFSMVVHLAGAPDQPLAPPDPAESPVPDTPWTLRFDGGSHDLTRIEHTGDEASWAYEPVTPEQSSSGTYSGGEPASGELPAEAIEALWAEVRAAIDDTGSHVDTRAMGTASLSWTTPDDRGEVLLDADAARRLADRLDELTGR